MLANKCLFSILLFLILFLTGIKSNAAIINDINVDTYTIRLNGINLNEVSGLNITVKLPRKQADITTGITFTAMGASALLTSVTGPSNEEYVISIVLNGMITDKTATITGKFVENSVLNGGEFLVTKINRDGGEDLTNLLTTEISFSNSKATPTPSPSATPSATPSTTPSTTPSSSPTSTPTANVNPSPSEADKFIDVLIGNDDTFEVDPQTIRDTFSNGQTFITTIKGSDQIQLKSNGLNKVYVRVNGLIRNLNEGDNYKIYCYMNPIEVTVSENLTTETPSEYAMARNPVLYASFRGKKNNIARFSKRLSFTVLPVPETDGEKLFDGSLSSSSLKVNISCTAFAASDKALKEFLDAEAKTSVVATAGTSIDELSSTQLIMFLLSQNGNFSSAEGTLFYSLNHKNVTLLAPTVADINEQ